MERRLINTYRRFWMKPLKTHSSNCSYRHGGECNCGKSALTHDNDCGWRHGHDCNCGLHSLRDKKKPKKEETVIKSVFAQNTFQQRILEADVLKADSEHEKKMELRRKDAKKLHGDHCDQIKTYLGAIERLLDGEKDRKNHDHYDVDRVKKVHDRVKDVHDHLDRYKELPSRTVTEGQQ